MSPLRPLPRAGGPGQDPLPFPPSLPLHTAPAPAQPGESLLSLPRHLFPSSGSKTALWQRALLLPFIPPPHFPPFSPFPPPDPGAGPRHRARDWAQFQRLRPHNLKNKRRKSQQIARAVTPNYGEVKEVLNRRKKKFKKKKYKKKREPVCFGFLDFVLSPRSVLSERFEGGLKHFAGFKPGKNYFPRTPRRR